jgi:TatD DNase family protein
MKLQVIETHAHIYDEAFAEDKELMLSRAKEVGVSEIWMPNCNSDTIESMMVLARNHPTFCLPMIGLHPCYVKEGFEKELQIVEENLNKTQFLAIGEIGMDLYWDKTFVAQQEEAFLFQCQLAKKHNLWIDIHSRDAFWETVALIEKNGYSGLKGIFHCFSGGEKEVEKAIELGFLMGIGGVVTFKNGGLDKIIPAMDLQHIVLETDAPYLAPVPHRGNRNETSYLPLIAQKIADLKEISIEEVLRITTENAQKLSRNYLSEVDSKTF